jgi:hypothetical protein
MLPRNPIPVESLREEKPAKLVKLVGLAWPEIEAALQQGHTLKRIHQRFVQSGIPITCGDENIRAFPKGKRPWMLIS